jgi:hypothetical protein
MIFIPQNTLAKNNLLPIIINLSDNLLGSRYFNVDVFRVGILRDELTTSIGSTICFQKTTEYEIPLPENIASGLYKGVVKHQVQHRFIELRSWVD